jgi:hypothetical protein
LQHVLLIGLAQPNMARGKFVIGFQVVQGFGGGLKHGQAPG